ncbi:MAG: hypothetical protein WDM92_13735 [Caulobacteraceae bacterium]
MVQDHHPQRHRQTIVGEFAILPAMRLGGLRFNDVPVAFADLHIFRLWDLEDRPAMLLGVDVLSRFPFVALDFARAEVRFRLPQRSLSRPRHGPRQSPQALHLGLNRRRPPRILAAEAFQ